MNKKSLDKAISLRKSGMGYEDIEVYLRINSYLDHNNKPYHNAAISASVVKADPSLRVRTRKKKSFNKQTASKQTASKQTKLASVILALKKYGKSDTAILKIITAL